MVASIESVAYAICDNCGWNINKNRLMNILYISHMVYFGYENKPLVVNDFSKYAGSIYHGSLELEEYDFRNIPDNAFPNHKEFVPDDNRLILIKIITDYFSAWSTHELNSFMFFEYGCEGKVDHRFASNNIMIEYNKRFEMPSTSKHSIMKIISRYIKQKTST